MLKTVPITMSSKDIKNTQTVSSPSEIKGFLTQARTKASQPQAAGRLLFAVDATASRQPAWDQAREIQNAMFNATHTLGGLSLQLCYYRGHNEFTSSPWLYHADSVKARMQGIQCHGGYTQIEKVLTHALKEHRQKRIQALIFIGDAVEEDVDHLCHLAGQMGLLTLPLFAFQEGNDPFASQALKQLTKLSSGAHMPFNTNSPAQLAELLGAVAVFATAGKQALQNYLQDKSQQVKQLTQHLTR